jgi:hypothetical protein
MEPPEEVTVIGPQPVVADEHQEHESPIKLVL